MESKMNYQAINNRKELKKVLKEISVTCRFFRMKPAEGETAKFRMEFNTFSKQSILPTTYIVQTSQNRWRIHCNGHIITEHENQYECIRKFGDLYRTYGTQLWRPELD